MPPPFIMGGGGHIVSPLSVRPYVRTYVRTYIRTYVRTYVHTSRTYEKWFPGDIF